jgi:glycyl-tRNA synthetase
MVVELTSLQGTMGREYALLSGEPAVVAEAIFEHYLPRYQGDILPESRASLALGLANRLDSLVGLFSVGFAPTGSTDPFGLRREALGVAQVLTGKDLHFDLRPALQAAAQLLPNMIQANGRGGESVGAAAVSDVLAFIRDRQYGLLRDEGLPHDVVSAVLAEQSADPYGAALAARELSTLVAASDWSVVLTAYARCKRIVRSLPEIYSLAPEHYSEEATFALHGAWEAAAKTVKGQPSVTVLGGVMRGLKAPINRFFTDVLVMAEDPTVRQARLALVQRIAALPDGIADLSQLQGF